MSTEQALPTRLVNRLALTRLGQTVAIDLALLALIWKLLRPAGRRILAAYRRYTGGNGDALAGALTYALLVGCAPAVLLCSALLSTLRLAPWLTGSTLLVDAHS